MRKQEIMLTDLTLLMTQPGGEGSGGGGFSFILFIGLFFVIIYFFMIRPQSKKAKDQKNFLNEIKKGDRVVTIGGVHGKIIEVTDDTYLIEVDSNTKLRIEKSVISLDFTRALKERGGEKSEKR